MKRILRLFVCLIALTATFVRAETLTNDAVIQLHKLGLGDSVVIQKIKASTCTFDTSIDGLKSLKDAGLSDEIIQAMVVASTPAPAVPPVPVIAAPTTADPNDPKAPHQSGIYLYEEVDGKPKMTRMALSATKYVQTGNGAGAAFGAPIRLWETLEGGHAALQLNDPKPSFYFYFDIVKTSLGRPDMSATSPDDFALVALEVHSKHDASVRRVETSHANMLGLHGGINKKILQNISSEAISDGVFKVTPAEGLKPGEYAIFRVMNGDIVGNGKVPDFGITGGK